MVNNVFDLLISLGDAGALYGKDEGGLRHAIARGKFVEGRDCKKFGKQWVFLRSALDREYGAPDIDPEEDS